LTEVTVTPGRSGGDVVEEAGSEVAGGPGAAARRAETGGGKGAFESVGAAAEILPPLSPPAPPAPPVPPPPRGDGAGESAVGDSSGRPAAIRAAMAGSSGDPDGAVGSAVAAPR